MKLSPSLMERKLLHRVPVGSSNLVKQFDSAKVSSIPGKLSAAKETYQDPNLSTEEGFVS